MVVRTSVSGTKGRHAGSARPGARPPRAPFRVVLVALGACAVIAAGTVAGLAATGSGSPAATHGPAGSVSATNDPSADARLNVTSPAPSARTRSPQARSSPAPSPRATPAAAAGRRDPFGAAAASYLTGRAGTVLAAVYDLRTGRTWHLGQGQGQGQGQPQAEASIVKLDVLETLLSEHGQGDGTGLSASDRSRADSPVPSPCSRSASSVSRTSSLTTLASACGWPRPRRQVWPVPTS